MPMTALSLGRRPAPHFSPDFMLPISPHYLCPSSLWTQGKFRNQKHFLVVLGGLVLPWLGKTAHPVLDENCTSKNG